MSFNIWKSKDGTWEWTSLMGDCKKKVLNKLPEKLHLCVGEDILPHMEKLWKVGFKAC